MVGLQHRDSWFGKPLVSDVRSDASQNPNRHAIHCPSEVRTVVIRRHTTLFDTVGVPHQKDEIAMQAWGLTF